MANALTHDLLDDAKRLAQQVQVNVRKKRSIKRQRDRIARR